MGCLPFLRERGQPGWRLDITSGWTATCDGGVTERFELTEADGGIVAMWTKQGVRTRELRLTADEIALVDALGRLDCDHMPPSDQTWFHLSVGDAEAEGYTAYPTSTLNSVVGLLVTSFTDRYIDMRLAAAGQVDIEMSGVPPWRPYRLVVNSAGEITVSRRREVLLHALVEPGEIVDLLDARYTAPLEDGLVTRGMLRMAGASISLEVSTRDEDSPSPRRFLSLALRYAHVRDLTEP